MKYVSFEINKYRAIENATVAVSNNLIPIIGVNESGKTTVLHAILAFDKEKDKYNGGDHLIHKNRYVTREQEGSVVASIVIETEDELDLIAEDMSLKVADELYKSLKKYQKDAIPIQVSRNFPSRRYSIVNFDLRPKNQKGEKLALSIVSKLPLILYFDDFSDRVPPAVTFPINNEDGSSYSLPNTSNIEWHQILQEVFTRSTEDADLKDFIETRDPGDQNGIISDIQDHLQKQVVEDWKNLKQKYGSDIGEEGENLQLKLDWRISENKKNITFSFLVNDRSTGKGRDFGVTQRSKGFQWFFNFIMKLKYNPKYKSDLKGAIYLLDEPGSYLHNSAQTELLKKLKEISTTNTILYCTHSEYLLDPEEINVANIKIAQKEGGSIRVLPMDSSGQVKSEGAFAPLYKALHMKSGFFKKDVEYPVITEGITDFYLFKMLAEFKEDFFKSEISFIPGAGATCLKDLISNSIAFSKRYLVLLDSDKEGNKAYETYAQHFGLSEAKNFFKYKIPNKEINVLLEDLISSDDKKRLISITGIEDVKSAIPALYYKDSQDKKEFISGLDKESLINLGIIKGKVNGLLG